MIIPAAFFFDQNYLIPSSVAIISLLTNASSEHEYHIHVFYNGISEEDIFLLSEVCNAFSNATFFSRDMNGLLGDLFEETSTKSHYSKEMYYKLIAPSLLLDYDRAIISDVDVVFLGDVSTTFLASLNCNEDLISGCRVPAPSDSFAGSFLDHYQTDFSKEERDMLLVAGGYYVFNLASMRAEKIEESLVKYARDNSHRLRQPEQDVISLVCFPRISILPLPSLICTYCYDLFSDEASFTRCPDFSPSEIRHALENPVQLHYATGTKPWNTPDCTKSEVWHRYLFLTPFARRYLAAQALIKKTEVLWSTKIPGTKTRELAVIRRSRFPARTD